VVWQRVIRTVCVLCSGVTATHEYGVLTVQWCGTLLYVWCVFCVLVWMRVIGMVRVLSGGVTVL